MLLIFRLRVLPSHKGNFFKGLTLLVLQWVNQRVSLPFIFVTLCEIFDAGNILISPYSSGVTLGRNQEHYSCSFVITILPWSVVSYFTQIPDKIALTVCRTFWTLEQTTLCFTQLTSPLICRVVATLSQQQLLGFLLKHRALTNFPNWKNNG